MPLSERTGRAATYSHGRGDQHAVACAARAHMDPAGIHPFPDANGQTRRLGVAALLLQSGYPPAL